MINLNSIFCNLSRAVEIAKTGSHPVKVYFNEGEGSTLDQPTQQMIFDFFGIEQSAAENSHLLIEVSTPHENEVLSLFFNNRAEDSKEVEQRIKAGQDFLNKVEQLPKQESAKTLLKTAISRLKLSVFDVQCILSVSRSIAALEGSESIKLEHLAEAIQYKSIPHNQR